MTKRRLRLAKPERPPLYDEITQTIIAELEAGCVPWVQPWSASGGPCPSLPHNAATGRHYSGINILLLWSAALRFGFSRASWLTFRQALAIGGNVRRGERGVSVIYASRFTPKDGSATQRLVDGSAPGGIPFLKRFTVFAVEQCDGLPAPLMAPAPAPLSDALILPEVAALIRASGADLRTGGDQAFYAPALDIVQVPFPAAFAAPIDWHRTALHELSHWTGHPTRLRRDQTGRFGSPAYAREELVAELGAAFCCAALGIRPTVRHADYIGSWLDVMRADSRAVVRAASAASRAADFLLAFRPGAQPGPAEEEDGGSGAAGVNSEECLRSVRHGD